MSEAIPGSFRAFRIHSEGEKVTAGVDSVSLGDLTGGDVTLQVKYSSVNFKDALAATGSAPICRSFPMVGGIDAAGTVVRSESERFAEGDTVVITGAGLSETRDGGYSEYMNVDSQWLNSLPEGLSALHAMTLGTAGFTAAMSLYRMEQMGQTPDMGPVVVTGATGGVGSVAINLLATAGYEVHAISGKTDRFEWLQSLGASECYSRDELDFGGGALGKGRWAGCVDSVGGDMLAGICKAIKPWGNVAACGLAGGVKINTSVMPFIVRGVSLLGIESPGCPMNIRQAIWPKLAAEWRPKNLDDICTGKTNLEGLGQIFQRMLKGESLGRVVVEPGQTD